MDKTLADLRSQVEQIDALHAAGTLGTEAHAAARADLERKIVERVTQSPEAPEAREPPPYALMAGLVILVLAIFAGGYAWLGTPKPVAPITPNSLPVAGTEPQAPHALDKDQIASTIEALVARLKSQPDDAEGWGMLARTYANLGDHAKAVPAFRKAQALRSDDPVLLADFADSLAMNNGRRLDGEPTRLIELALRLDPNDPKALSLAGTAAFDRKDYAGAIKHWEKLQQVAAPDNVLAAQVRGGLEEARQLGGLASPATAPAALSVTPKAAVVGGTVNLAPGLAVMAAPGDTLFVFARPAQGSRMPLAILRMQVKDLPLRFTLDDSLAMSPSAKLSSSPQVIVGARISKSGQATPLPGDLLGQSAAVPLGRTDLVIEISDIVP